MSMRALCRACSNEDKGVHSNIAVPHTCGLEGDHSDFVKAPEGTDGLLWENLRAPTQPPPQGEGPKLYLAGKVTGLPFAETTAKFGAAQKQLESRGFAVVNPLEVVSDQHGLTPKADRFLDTPWQWCMRWCIAALTGCDAVVMLPCWTNSRGATLERCIASILDMPIYEGLSDPKLKAISPDLAAKCAG